MVAPLNGAYIFQFTPVSDSLLFYIQTFLSLLIYITFLDCEGLALPDPGCQQPATPVSGYTSREMDLSSWFFFFFGFQAMLATHYVRTVLLNWR